MDDLTDLFWSLTRRYAYFLDVASADLSLETFARIRDDLQNESLVLFDSELETNSLTESRSTVLMRAVVASEAKCCATRPTPRAV